MQITIPDNAENWLRQRAEQSGFSSVQDYILAVVLPRHQSEQKPMGSRSFYDAAREAGLLGGGSEYAPDLSTNPGHMVGFGR